jgi:hypothetical protein
VSTAHLGWQNTLITQRKVCTGFIQALDATILRAYNEASPATKLGGVARPEYLPLYDRENPLVYPTHIIDITDHIRT